MQLGVQQRAIGVEELHHEVGRAFGFASWSLREVNVQTDSALGQPMPRLRATAAMAAPVDEALPVEAGKATVSVTVAGSITLSPR